MQKVLYLDSIFLHNLVLDFLILKLTLKTLQKSTTFFRVTGGAAVGAGMYCIALYLSGSLIFGILVKGITVLLMLKVTAPFQRGKELLTGMLFYFTFALFLGGGMLFVRSGQISSCFLAWQSMGLPLFYRTGSRKKHRTISARCGFREMKECLP